MSRRVWSGHFAPAAAAIRCRPRWDSTDVAARSSMVKRSRIRRACAPPRDRSEAAGRHPLRLVGAPTAASAFFDLALRIAPRRAAGRASPGHSVASLRLSCVRRAPCRTTLGRKAAQQARPTSSPNFSIIDASVSLGRRKLQHWHRQHALLQPRHGQRRHRDVLAVIGLRQVFAAHVDIVGDQMLALARRIGAAAKRHAEPRHDERAHQKLDRRARRRP